MWNKGLNHAAWTLLQLVFHNQQPELLSKYFDRLDKLQEIHAQVTSTLLEHFQSPDSKQKFTKAQSDILKIAKLCISVAYIESKPDDLGDIISDLTALFISCSLFIDFPSEASTKADQADLYSNCVVALRSHVIFLIYSITIKMYLCGHAATVDTFTDLPQSYPSPSTNIELREQLSKRLRKRFRRLQRLEENGTVYQSIELLELFEWMIDFLTGAVEKLSRVEVPRFDQEDESEVEMKSDDSMASTGELESKSETEDQSSSSIETAPSDRHATHSGTRTSTLGRPLHNITSRASDPNDMQLTNTRATERQEYMQRDKSATKLKFNSQEPEAKSPKIAKKDSIGRRNDVSLRGFLESDEEAMQVISDEQEEFVAMPREKVMMKRSRQETVPMLQEKPKKLPKVMMKRSKQIDFETDTVALVKEDPYFQYGDHFDLPIKRPSSR